ncbi:MAG TPA: glycosyltransferase [Chloroflexota bacterium]|nr:glycosyltransferase [Chloroflexota bacterium]
MLIAQALAAPPLNANVLMITGTRHSGAFTMPARVDCLTLPGYYKDLEGEYHARSLGMPAASLSQLRGQVIKAGLANFAPDIFIVDNVPRGAMGELVPALEHLASCDQTKCVLGLRDVLDTPYVVQQQWLRQGTLEVIANFYNEVWIYGDPAVYDTAAEYSFSEALTAKTRYTGYLDPAARLEGSSSETEIAVAGLEGHELALCVLGGGQDGVDVAWNFAAAELPVGTRGIILTGPFMPRPVRRRLARLSTHHPRLSVLEFVSDPMPVMKLAKSIVAMGGYNTVSEILSLEKRGLLVPRSKPRMEQLIRAERLKALGLLDYIENVELTPDRITAWLHEAGSPPPARGLINFDGLARVSSLVSELLDASPPASELPKIVEQGGLRLVR